MKEVIQHSALGEIVYEESFWTGKKTLTINGVEATRLNKKEFLINGEKALLKGSLYAGVKLCLGGEEIVLIPSSKWYELVLAVLPFSFLLTWGNSPTLCAVFPVVGGAIGGALGGLGGCYSLLMMKRSKSVAKKLLIGVGAFVLTILVAFVLALLLISALS